MPEITPNLGLKQALGNETVSRAAYNENLGLIDQNAAKASDVAAHLVETMPHRFTDGGVTYRWGLAVIDGVVNMVYEEVV